MGTQSSAAITLSLAVNATNYGDTLQYTSTVGTFTTDVGPISSAVWQYLYTVGASAATPSSSLKWINGVVRITDVTAPRTPYGAYTFNGATPVAVFQENQHFRSKVALGPFDFQDQPTLSAALSAQLAQAVAFTPNY